MFCLKKMVQNKLVFMLVFLFLLPIVFAHEGESDEEFEGSNVHDGLDRLHNKLFYTAVVSSALLLAIAFISIYSRSKTKAQKKLFFFLILLITVFSTVYIAYTTIKINNTSISNGPVHWHADFEIFVCGEKVDLVTPKGLSNRVGTSVFHEHGDNRIHVEGPVFSEQSVDLEDFFSVFGGALSSRFMVVPTDSGFVSVEDGGLCNGKPAKLQAFLYRVVNPVDDKNWRFTQLKLKDFPHFVLAPYSHIPPGDCVVIEFGDEKPLTKNICNSYIVAMEKGELAYGS